MADYKAAFDKLLQLEAFPGYVNHPDDHGGETFAGISRRFWPKWDGWRDVDVWVAHGKTRDNLDPLWIKVNLFYRENFWHKRLADLNNQELANWLFQMAVNSGWKMTVKFLQRAVGTAADGVWGDKTQGLVAAANQKAVLALCRSEALKFYQGLVDRDPSQLVFLNGWRNRAMA